MGIGSIGSSYFNFVFGTGAEKAGAVIKRQLKNRAYHKQGYFSALANGTVKGIKVANKSQARVGFFKSLKNGFSAIPAGWKSGKGLGKLTGALKGCGKAMPALFAGLMILGEVPNVYKAIKEKGFVQGIKEVGKTVVRLGAGALGSAIGTAVCPFAGSIVGWMAGEWIASKIVGKSYSEKVAEKETNPLPTTNDKQQTPVTLYNTGSTPAGSGIVGGGHVPLPPIDADDFGPYKPYANIFYNYPQAYMDMGARMPGQSGIAPMMPGMGIGMMGMGTTNNVSPNLLDKLGNQSGNLLANSKQNAYSKVPNPNTGNKLNIEK